MQEWAMDPTKKQRLGTKFCIDLGKKCDGDPEIINNNNNRIREIEKVKNTFLP
jgi:hypothetical protein